MECCSYETFNGFLMCCSEADAYGQKACLDVAWCDLRCIRDGYKATSAFAMAYD
jgi:hypothetical protein